MKRILNAQFIKTGRDVENKRETQALEPEEVMAMVEEADTVRDRLFPLLYFECGAQPGELFDIAFFNAFRLFTNKFLTN